MKSKYKWLICSSIFVVVTFINLVVFWNSNPTFKGMAIFDFLMIFMFFCLLPIIRPWEGDKQLTIQESVRECKK